MGHFLPFDPPNNPKIKIFKKWKNMPRDIIILHLCTINDNHMYSSWDMEHDRHFFVILTIFCPFTPVTTQKIKTLKKWKKRFEILSFHTCAPQMKIIWCMVLEIWSVTDTFFSNCGSFFALLPIEQPRKSKFWKNRNAWRCHHFTQVHHNDNHMMYGSCNMKHNRQFFVILDHFLHFNLTKNQKNKNFEKIKKKKKGKYYHLTHAPIIMIRCMVPEIWCDTDGRMDRWTENVTYGGGRPT